MKLYGGIDLHSNNSVIHLVNEQGDSVLKKRVANDLTAIVMLLTPFLDRIFRPIMNSHSGST